MDANPSEVTVDISRSARPVAFVAKEFSESEGTLLTMAFVLRTFRRESEILRDVFQFAEHKSLGSTQVQKFLYHSAILVREGLFMASIKNLRLLEWSGCFAGEKDPEITRQMIGKNQNLIPARANGAFFHSSETV